MLRPGSKLETLLTIVILGLAIGLVLTIPASLSKSLAP